MKARKFNYETHEYESYEILDGLCCRTRGEKMNCAGCGREMVYEEGGPSLVLRDKEGSSYIVCSDCLEKEWQERVKWARREITHME